LPATSTLSLNAFLNNANFVVNDIPDIDLSLKPILQFPDVWHNITYIAGYFKIILALIVVSSVSNEFTQSTLRQNVIDGFSRQEWVYSKIGLAFLLALYSTVLVIIVGLFLGFSQGEGVGFTAVFSRMDFVLAYFFELTTYFVYALFLALIIKRTGLSVILLLVYDFVLEPIISWSLPEKMRAFLPMNTIDNLIKFPFGKYVNMEVQEAVSAEQFTWAVIYAIVFSFFSYFVLKRKDL